jgi:hypothetical protein
MNAGLYVFGAIAILTVFLIPVFIVSLAIAVGCFFGKKKLYVEYEYVFTNGEIDIDKILEMKKRSRVLTFNVKDIELLAPEDSYYIKDFSNKPSKVISVYPKTSNEKVFVAMITGGTERVQLRFVPDEEFINLCYKYNPRAVKKS